MNSHFFCKSSGVLSTVLPTAFALALVAAPLAYSQKVPLTLSRGDNSFAKDAAEGGMAEVKMGQLAQTNAMNAKVKMFGERMVTDHTKMGDELKGVASRKNITLPSDISSKQQSTYKTLSAKTGADFDKAYISDMVKDHEEDIAAFQKEANSGTDEDLKAFASKALPTLQEHLKMAQDIARELGVSVK